MPTSNFEWQLNLSNPLKYCSFHHEIVDFFSHTGCTVWALRNNFFGRIYQNIDFWAHFLRYSTEIWGPYSVVIFSILWNNFKISSQFLKLQYQCQEREMPKKSWKVTWCIATSYLPLSDIVLFLHFDWDCQNSEEANLWIYINTNQIPNLRVRNLIYIERM